MGGGPFPTCTISISFSKIFACVDFFFNNPLLELFFCPKIVGERGGGGGGENDLKIKGSKNIFRTNISLVKV